MHMFFEDFGVGQSYQSPGRTISEADVVNFAAFSGDWFPLHTDEEYSRGRSSLELHMAFLAWP